MLSVTLIARLLIEAALAAASEALVLAAAAEFPALVALVEAELADEAADEAELLALIA